MLAMDDLPPTDFSWLRGFSVGDGCFASLNEDGTVRSVRPLDERESDTINNNPSSSGPSQADQALLSKLKQDQDIMKSTFVAFRRWAMEATKALRMLEARAETAERRAEANQGEVLRLQELLAKYDKTNTRKRKSKSDAVDGVDDVDDVEGANELEDEGSSGCDEERGAGRRPPEKKLSMCGQ